MDISTSELKLLQAYALPHMRFPTDGFPVGTFRKLIDKGLVREGIGRAISPIGTTELNLTGNESAEEFEAALQPRLVDTPGWVLTERGVQMILLMVEAENRPKTEAVLRTFIADKDPVVN